MAADSAARLLSLFDQREGMATADALRAGRQAEEATAKGQVLRGDVARGLASVGLGVETDLSREDLYERLRSIAVRRAHLAETALEAATQETAAAEATQRQAEAAARATAVRRKAQKVQRWLDLSRRRGRVVEAATQSTDIEETFACRQS